jgi:ATP-dependent DNA ligase
MLGRYFPDLVAAVTDLAVDVVLDGEIVIW